MKNSLKYIVVAVLACGLTSVYYTQIAEPKIKEVKVVEVVEKPVTQIQERIVEVEKIIYKRRSCSKLNKEKLCAGYFAEQQSEALNDIPKNAEQQYSSLEQPSMLKNRVNILAGYGRTGSQVNLTGNSVNIEPKKGAVFSGQYERKINKRANVNVLIQTNTTFSIGGGWDF